MERKNKHFNNRFTSLLRYFLCALLIAMLVIPFATLTSNDIDSYVVTSESLSYSGLISTTSINSMTVDDIDVSLYQSLTNNGDGTYSIELTPKASFSVKDLSAKSTDAKYGYFMAPKNGTYIFEVWGGNGGEGQDTSYSNGGKGGQGGYLNASLEMQKGDYIFYTIGGNGQQTPSKSYGGGANGDGGDHGESGRYIVGGGGGYTAVYYFAKGANANSFAYKYLDGTSLKVSNLDEADRLTKYVLVAGGGGGGGAGNAFSVTNKAIATPDGGNAGSLTSASGTITNAEVPGTYYAGSNGKSSGTSQEYVGVGGSNTPGEEKSTLLDFYDGKVANDWAGSFNAEYPGGSGGAGNLRGGAGGAGFCGGSGGIMTGLVVGTNVGGGGGGSSFIANTMSSLTAEQQKYITNDNESSTGGAVYITFVPSQTELDVVQNLTLSGTISDYFTIESVTVSDSAVVSTSGKNFSISKVNALEGATPETTITIKVKPVTGFMGGNDVPIFTTDQKIAFQKSTDSSTSYEIGVSDSCAYLNLPYAYTDPTTYQKNTFAKVSDLFVDAGYTNTDFITVSSYSIKDSSGTSYTNLDATLSPEATTIYTVLYTVEPKEEGSKAVVGDRLSSKIYTANAKILVAAKNVLNGNTMEVSKTLSYASNVYTLNVNVKTNGTYEISPSKPSSSTNTYSSPGTGSYTVSTSGYYYIQVWGGNGGKGGAGSKGESGASGGSGGYVGAYVHLNKNDVVTYIIGRNGQVGNDTSDWTKAGCQGEGGKLTSVSLNSSTIVIAGGGGGGGGGAYKLGGGSSAAAGESCTSFNSGSDGSPSNTTTNDKSAGSAGTNYIDSTKATSQTTYKIGDDTLSSESYSNNGGGAVYISCISTDGYKNLTLSDYSVEASFADNFELIATTPVSASGVSSKTINGALVSSIVPSENVTSNVQYVNFTVTYKLKAKDSCLGGNSILLLKAVKISQVDKNSSTIDDVIYAEAKETTDYANVAISQTYVNNHFTVTANTVDYLVGSTGIEKSQLYSTSTTFTPSASDYVESYLEEVPLIEAISTPTTSKSFDIHYGLKPKTTAVNGIVGPVAVNTYVNSNYTAKINAYQEVEFNLTNVTATAPTKTFDSVEKYIATNSNNYTATLSAVGDNKIVCVGSVQIDGEEIKNYTFDSSTGTITIPKDEITGKVTISAGSKDKDIVYKLYFAYAKDREGSSYGTKTPLDFKAEADISTALSNLVTLSPAPTSYTGYKYVIEYPNGDICDYPNVSSTFTKMPAENTWIFAYYVPIEYTLTINYVNESGTSLADSIVLNNKDTDTTCYYDMAFSYDSPAVANYAPDHVEVNKTTVTTYGSAATVSGKMPNSDLTINVVYKSLGPNEVSVTISYADGFKPTVQNNVTKSEGKITITYSGETGYDVVKSEEFSSGVAFATTSQFITITYVPKQYEVIFSSGSGASTCDNRAVFYSKEYGYTLTNGATKYEDSSFEPFPVPVKNGWVFEGWFIDNTKITESTVFNGSANVTLTANWLPYELTSEYVTIENIADKTYTGKAIEPALSVKWNLSKVTWLTAEEATIKSTYYSIKYENNVNVDDDSVAKVIFNGYRYSGTIAKDFNITQANNTISSLELESWTYGSPNSPSSDATFGKDTVTYSYSDSETGTFVATKPSDVGTYYVKATIAETSNYKGATKTISFAISSKVIDDIDDITVELVPDEDYTYDGKDHKPTQIIVKDGDDVIDPENYDIVYENTTKAPKGKIKIKFKKNYEGTDPKDVEYVINPLDTSTIDLTITLYEGLNVVTSNTYTYDGKEKEPTVTITHNAFGSLVTLEKDKDFTIDYSNNKDAGTDTATVNISYIGNYSGTASEKFTIKPKVIDDIDDITVELVPDEDYTYDGKDHKPTQIIVKDGDDVIDPENYDIEYENTTKAPKGKIKIKFKKNYEGTDPKDIEYVINPLDLTSGDTSISLSQYTYTYSGSECTPTVTIYHDTFGKLIEGTDFDVEYVDNTNVGTAKANITYKGNYTGTASESFTINSKVIDDLVVILDPDNGFPYNGEEHELNNIIVKDGNEILSSPDDYEIEYINKKDAPKGKFKIKFKGNYKDTPDKEVEFDITPLDTSTIDLTITLYEGLNVVTSNTYTYDGKEKEPTVTITHNEFDSLVTLVEGTDFEVTYSNNTNAGTATVNISYIGNYSGTDSKDFTINSKEIEDLVVTLVPDDGFPYDGKEHEPIIEVKDGDTPLNSPDDYEIEYINKKDAPKGKFKIKFKGNYKDTPDKEVEYDITPLDLTSGETSISLSQYTYTYSGSECTPTVTIYHDTLGKLIEGTDFDVEYVDNTNVGTAKANITYKGNYSGTASESFTINKLDPSNPDGPETTIELSQYTYTYSGSACEPTVTITITGIGTLVEGTDFDVEYVDNTNAGTAAANITYKGNYSGTASESFTINSKVITPTITITPEELTYDGDELEPEVEVKDENGNPLTENEDYIVTYDDNTSIPKGKIKIEFINNYKNTPTENKEFTINPKTPSESETVVTFAPASCTYTGSAWEPVVYISIENIGDLTEGTDFDVTYSNNINAGAATVNITYKGNYTGTATAIFTINKVHITAVVASIDGKQYDKTTTGSGKLIAVGAVNNETPVVEGTFTWASSNAGTDTITISNIHLTDAVVNNNYILDTTLIEDYKINDTKQQIQKKTYSPSDFEWSFVDDEFTYDGTEKSVSITSIPEAYTAQYKNAAKTTAGTYVASVKLVPNDPSNYEPLTIDPLVWTINRATYDMSNAKWDYTDAFIYDGTEKSVHVINLPEGVSVGAYYSATQTAVGTYYAIALLSYDTTNYNAPVISELTWTINKKPTTKDLSDKDGIVTVETEDGIPYDLEIYVELKASAEGKETANGTQLSLQNELGFGEAFGDVYEIKIMRDGQEIQPSDIAPGTILKVKMKVPENLVGKTFRIIHIHNNDDISYITKGNHPGIGTYIIDEEGYIITMINKFSEFAFVYNVECISHWFLLALLLLFIAFVIVYITVLEKKVKKNNILIPIIGSSVFALGTLIAALLGTCYYCIIMTIVNGFALVIAMLLFAYRIFKNKPTDQQVVKVIETIKEVPTTVVVEKEVAPIVAEAKEETPIEEPIQEETIEEPVTVVEEVEPVVEEIAEEAPIQEEIVEEGISLKESIALASTINQTEENALSMSKMVVYDYLNNNYKDIVELNHRVNYTKTGLPLADTHYDLQSEKKVCFTYVYELENGNVFFLIRANNQIANEIKEKHNSLVSSAFPKSAAKDWYTMVLDDSFKSNDDVYEVLDMVLGKQIDDNEEGLSLKESIELAKNETPVEKEELHMSKKAVCDYLCANYDDKVEINTRINYTKTGLPLADTHYDLQSEKKVCFTYVYELENGNVFFLIRANNDTAKLIKAKHNRFKPSAFPKSPAKDWYTMILDDSFNSNEDVFEVLDLVLNNDSPIIPTDPSDNDKTNENDNLSLKESIELAKNESATEKEELNMSKQAVCDYLNEKYKESVEINTRVNYTKTGLPLADTHYDIRDGKVCFTYVYELEDGTVFFLIRTNDQTAKAIKAKHAGLKSSAFPKSAAHDWYTMILDDSFKSNDDVFEVLDMILEKKEADNLEGVSLKESIELAKNDVTTEKEELHMSKKAICDYLSESYKDKVEINTRINYTKTGLPLADTHYDLQNEKKVCFTYVYELDNGNVFFLIRANNDIAKLIKAKHAGLKSSAFPKSAAHDWYTMILDDSFKSNEDVFEVLDMILEKKEANNLEGVSLKESIALAQNEVTSNKETLNISKNAICEYLNKYHKEEVEINTRENYTKTGLPLADTHYDLKNSNRICFTYVYELNDGTVFLLIRTNEETSSKIKAKHKGLISSAFPKSSKKEWYTMILDDSFKSNKDVFDVLDMVLASNKVEKTLIEQLIEDAIVEEPIKEEAVIVVEEKVIEKPIVETKTIEKEEQYITPSIEEVIEEKIEEENSLNTSNEEPIAPIHEIIKEEVSVTQAQEIFADEEIKDIVEKDSANEERYSVPGKEDCVNIDILSKSFENGDTVDIQALKNKNLVSKNATKIKILARGKLNKSLIVYADNYSTDAAKMIVACGGKLIELRKNNIV